MNARCLAAWSAAVLTVVLISTNPAYRLAAALIALDVTIVLSRPGQRLRPLLVAICAAIATAVAVDILLGHSGEHVLARVPSSVPVIGGPITVEAILYGLVVGLGVAACVLGVAPLSRALDPHELVDALPRVLHRTATAMAAALNLVPGMVRSARAVRDAQRMRGWRPGGARSWSELLVPVAVTAMEDSLQLAEAMEARGYGSGQRTRFASPVLRGGDIAVLLTSLLAITLVVVARTLGLDDDWYPIPSPTLPPVQPLPVLACALLVTPLVAWRPQRFAG
jgi:energy-coupling factor transport system permease protein